MKYNFDEITERRDTCSLKWDAPAFSFSARYCPSRDIIPMWVADMDFRTPEFVTEAMAERIKHPMFGYAFTPEEYFEVIGSWHKDRYNQGGVDRTTVSYHNSVLGGVASAISALTQAGDNILIQSPTYVGFQSTINNMGRNMVFTKLTPDQNGVFRMDFEEMEKIMSTQNIPVFLFCSPHNPTGRIWDKDELEKVVELCDKYDVKIISDEIWADFILSENKKHIPLPSLNETSKKITFGMYAPSKTFNLAGLVGAYSVCYNRGLNNRVLKVGTSTHYNLPNVLSTTACIAGYTHGREWVNQMTDYLNVNVKYLVDFLNTIEGFSAYVPEATYLLWVDISGSKYSSKEIVDMCKTVGVIISDGEEYFDSNYLRLNYSLPFSVVKDACERIGKVLK